MSHYLTSDSYIDSARTYVGNTYTSTKYHVYNDELTPFDKKNVSSPQKIHFFSNVIKFLLGFIPNFGNVIAEMKTNQID